MKIAGYSQSTLSYVQLSTLRRQTNPSFYVSTSLPVSLTPTSITLANVDVKLHLDQPPRSTFPERPIPSTKKPNPHKTSIIPPAGYGPVKGSSTLPGGTGGKESLNTLGLVPQSVLLVRWEDESMNGEKSCYATERL